MKYILSRKGYYDSKVARFLSEDTYRGQANDPLSLNLYTYCHNNPFIYWDPTGHSIRSIIKDISSRITSSNNKSVYQEPRHRTEKAATEKIIKQWDTPRTLPKDIRNGENGNQTGRQTLPYVIGIDNKNLFNPYYDDSGNPSPNRHRNMQKDTDAIERRDCAFSSGSNNPIKPTGFSFAEGVAVHIMIQAWFFSLYRGYATVEYPIPSGLLNTISGSGRADMVLFAGRIAQVFEIKPVSYQYNSYLNAQGKFQLMDYIRAMNNDKKPFYDSAVPGESFNPNGAVLPCPWNSSKVIILSTNYAKDPGMIYYDIRNLTPDYLKGMEIIPGYNKPELDSVSDILITEKEYMDFNLEVALRTLEGLTFITRLGTAVKSGVASAKKILSDLLKLVPVY